MKYSIALPLLFVISLSAAPGHSLDFSQSVVMRGAAVFSRAENFEYKSQGSAALEFENTLAGDSFGIALTFGYHSASASNIAGGYAYRGWEGGHGWLSGEWYPRPANVPVGAAGDGGFAAKSAGPVLRPGLGAGLGGFFSKYAYTDILFFYPALRISLFTDLLFPGSPFRLRYAVPVEVYLRRDLESSFSVGMGLWGVFSWSRFMERRGTGGR